VVRRRLALQQPSLFIKGPPATIAFRIQPHTAGKRRLAVAHQEDGAGPHRNKAVGRIWAVCAHGKARPRRRAARTTGKNRSPYRAARARTWAAAERPRASRS
jgi:hypothetical protein